MQRRYKVGFRVGGKRLSQSITASCQSEAMDKVRKSIVFEYCAIVEPELNLMNRINELFKNYNE